MFPFISSVQAQNCQVLPSCAELGYTKTVELCEGQAYLTCPFDKSQVYCPFDCESKDCAEYTLSECPDKGICEECVAGCGNKTIKYKFNKCGDGYEWNDTYCIACDFASGGYTLTSCPANGNCTSITCGGVTKYKVNKCATGYYLANGTCNKIQNAIAFVVSVSSTGAGPMLYTGTTNDYTIDWGDGSIETYTNYSIPWHPYSAAGEYQIVITGNVPEFYIKNLADCYPTQILSIDLDTLSVIGNDSYSPAFYDCSNVTGTIPDKLPPNITKIYGLYAECSGLTGNIPTLPSELTDGERMFSGCTGLTGNIPNLPSGLTNGTSMFGGCTGLTGNIPDLPSGLTNGTGMFLGCTGLTGNIPDLPSGLTDGEHMFSGCTGLTGNIPDLPSGLTDGSSMFFECSNLTGNIPKLPSGLKKAEWMFYSCRGLNGTTPTIPPLFDATTCGDNFGECQLTFGHTQITNDGSWPSGAW